MTHPLRVAGFAVLCILSYGVAAYAVGMYAFRPLGAFVHPDMRQVFEAHRTAIYLHVFGAAVALALGPLQFSARLRRRNRALHRLSGRLYLGIGVLVGGLAGLYMAAYASGGPGARLGFGCLAVAWLYTGLRAYLAIRSRRVDAHRRWMVRNFALTLAAVMLRLYVPGAVAAGIPFEIAYPYIAWLCWLPNLVAAEALLRRPLATVPDAQP